MKGTVIILRDKKGKQYPNGKEAKYWDIFLSFDRDKAYLFKNDLCRATITRARIEFIAVDGIKLSGLDERHGRDGNMIYTYQEWWFQPDGVDKAIDLNYDKIGGEE